jgi:conjugative transposon TraM protein
MSINFKQPKYILPVIALPFLCLFFYAYHSSAAKDKKEIKHAAGINAAVGDVSPNIRKKELSDKLDAFRNRFKESDGNTAVSPILAEKSPNPASNGAYGEQQKRTLDSINRLMKMKFGTIPVKGTISGRDKALANALNNLTAKQKMVPGYSQESSPPPPKEKDPMEIFKQQMAYMDSVRKESDPAYMAEKKKQEALAKANAEHTAEKTLKVVKADTVADNFNTLKPGKAEAFIMAVIDENITGYAGSRLRLRLLEDIKAGKSLIKKDSYLYALISGFSGQRVTFEIKTILYHDQVLPVKLEVYDLDGLPGLYVPESRFRDFTKDLGTNSIQGVSIDNSSSTGSQFVMSAAGKVFQSTSGAIAGAIRKDKARIKYNSYIYLIDTDNSKNH